MPILLLYYYYTILHTKASPTQRVYPLTYGITIPAALKHSQGEPWSLHREFISWRPFSFSPFCLFMLSLSPPTRHRWTTHKQSVQCWTFPFLPEFCSDAPLTKERFLLPPLGTSCSHTPFWLAWVALRSPTAFWVPR